MTKKSVFYCIIILVLFKISVALPAEKSKKGIVINSKPQGATVYIENEVIGKTPCVFPYELEGKYKFWAEKKGYNRRSRTYTFPQQNDDPISFTLDPKNRARAVIRSLVVPGWGQSYTEQKWKSRVFFGLQVCSLVSLGISQIDYKSKLDEYNHQVKNYRIVSKSYELEKPAWQKVKNAQSNLDKANKIRQVIAISSLTIYAVNLLDAIFDFPQDLRQIEIIGSPLSMNNNSSLGIKLSFTL